VRLTCVYWTWDSGSSGYSLDDAGTYAALTSLPDDRVMPELRAFAQENTRSENPKKLAHLMADFIRMAGDLEDSCWWVDYGYAGKPEIQGPLVDGFMDLSNVKDADLYTDEETERMRVRREEIARAVEGERRRAERERRREHDLEDLRRLMGEYPDEARRIVEGKA